MSHNGGAHNGVRPQPYDADLVTFGDNPLTAAELQQLQNIGASDISAAEWGHLAGLDQDLDTTATPSFAGLTVTGARLNAVAGIDNNGLISLGNGSELTIASGEITVDAGFHRLDTESDASTDDLDTINGGTAGDIVVFRAVADARTIVFKDATGNLRLSGDISLDNSLDTITLVYQGAFWLQQASSDNAA